MYTFGEFFGNMLIQKYNFFFDQPLRKKQNINKKFGKNEFKNIQILQFFFKSKARIAREKNPKKERKLKNANFAKSKKQKKQTHLHPRIKPPPDLQFHHESCDPLGFPPASF